VNKHGSCPICGTPTEGRQIAGNVFDFQCDACVRETDADFNAFIEALLDDRLPDPGAALPTLPPLEIGAQREEGEPNE
jgi:hypothetical protein